MSSWRLGVSYCAAIRWLHHLCPVTITASFLLSPPLNTHSTPCTGTRNPNSRCISTQLLRLFSGSNHEAYICTLRATPPAQPRPPLPRPATQATPARTTGLPEPSAFARLKTWFRKRNAAREQRNAKNIKHASKPKPTKPETNNLLNHKKLLQRRMGRI